MLYLSDSDNTRIKSVGRDWQRQLYSSLKNQCESGLSLASEIDFENFHKRSRYIGLSKFKVMVLIIYI